MGILSGLFSNGIAEPIDAIGNVFDKLFTSKQEKMEAQAVLDKIKQKPEILRAEIVKLQTQHKSIFISGARPFLVWVAGVNLAQLGVAVIWFNRTIPEWYADASVTAFLGGLGLYGGLRTIEKLANKVK